MVDITEDEINNDIEYYIDSVKEYIDAKKKEFKEADVNRDEELTGGKWVTLPNGVHCYIKDGEIVEERY